MTFSISCRMLNRLYLPFNPQRREVFKVATSFYSCKSKSQLKRISPPANLLAQVPHCGCFANSYNSLFNRSALYTPSIAIRHCICTSNNEKPESKPSLYQRFKSMYRDYWYVLLPVHLVTSAAWFGSFYYLASSEVDIVALLEFLNVSEKVINPLRNGHATTGYLAISYALYKITTPLRYTVTLGGTTLSINYLKKWGYIRPVPSKEKLKEIYLDKKEILMEKKQTLKDNVMQTFKPTESKKKSS